MYRSKKGKGKKATVSETAAIHDAVAEAAAADLAALKQGSGTPSDSNARLIAEYGKTGSITAHQGNEPAGGQSLSQSIVELKAAFTTPSMVYSAAHKAIEVNPQYDRSTVAELSRVQGSVLGVLRASQASAELQTPKELLYNLEKAMYYLLTSTAVPDGSTVPLLAVGSEFDADQRMPMLESFFAQRSAPAKSIAATAHALAEGISKRTVESFLERLKARLAQESDAEASKRRTAEERAALSATANNVQDFAQILSKLLVAYEGIPRAASSAIPSMTGTGSVRTETQLASAELLAEAYYSLVRWVLAIDPERRTLASTPSVVAGSRGVSLKPSVTEYDAFEGRITLTRPTTSTPWGCLINAKGHLVGISNDLRNSSEAGERLYQALQHRSGVSLGVPILEANRRRIRSVEMGEAELQAEKHNILAGLRDAMSSETRTLHLGVPREAQEALTSPEEVIFELSSQGGENVSGQRVLLVLRRASTHIPWGVKMVKDSAGHLKLQQFSDNMRLSAKAKDFLFEHRGALTIVGLNHRDLVNHPEATAGASIRELIMDSLVMALWIQVAPSDKEEKAAVPEVTAETAEPNDLPEVEEDHEEAVDEKAADMEDLPEDDDHETAVEAEEDAPGTLEGGEAEDGGVKHVVDPDTVDAIADGEDATAPQANLDEGETTAAAVPDHENKRATVSSLRKGWELDDEDVDAADEVNEEGSADKETAAVNADEMDDELEHRRLLERHGVLTENEDAELLEGYGGFTTGSPKTTAVTEDLDTAVQDLLAEAKGNGEAVDGEMNAEVEGDVPAKKKRGRKPGSKNAAKETDKVAKRNGKGKGKKKGKKKAGRKSKKAGEEDMEAEDDDVEVEEDDAEPEATTADKEANAVDDTKEQAKAVEAAEEPEAIPTGNATTKDPASLGDAGKEEKPMLEHLATLAAVPDTLEAAKKNSKNGKGVAPTEETNARVSIADLVDADPLVFPNQVTLDKFDGTHMSFTRPDVNMPWQLKVGFAGDDMVLTGLPAHAGDPGVPASHPYLKYFDPFALAAGKSEGRCLVESVNGTDLATVSKANRTKIFDMIKNAANLNMVVKFVRKH